MIVADMDMVERYHQKLSEIRQRCFEYPAEGKLESSELFHIIGNLRTCAVSGCIQAKRVLGRALHLSSLFSCHRMDYGTCLRELNEMIVLARESGDVDMEAAALIQQGMLYSYEFRPSLWYATFHHAMQLEMSPLLRKRVLFGYAESLAASGQLGTQGEVERYQIAERTLEMAESVSVSDEDPGHAYVRWNPVTLAIHRARFLVANKQCSEATQLLKAFYSCDATADSVEILFVLAQAHSHILLRRQAEGSFEQTCFFVKALADGAKRMGSVLYLAQAQMCYELLMRSKWHRECSQRLLHTVSFSI